MTRRNSARARCWSGTEHSTRDATPASNDSSSAGNRPETPSTTSTFTDASLAFLSPLPAGEALARRPSPGPQSRDRRKVKAAAGPDFYRSPGEAGEELASILVLAARLAARCHAEIHPREERVVDVLL